MASKFITISFSRGQAEKYFAKTIRNNDVAIMRTLNVLSRQGIKDTAKEISEDHGIKQSSVRKRIKVTKATRSKHSFTWRVSGVRLPLTKPLVLKGGKKKRGGRRLGISHRLPGNIKEKLTTRHKGGSKPFIIPVNRSIDSKKVTKLPVYREKGFKKSVTMLAGHSIPFMVRVGWEHRTRVTLTKRLPIEYKKQLKRVRFR